jgi:hypothetical protein
MQIGARELLPMVDHMQTADPHTCRIEATNRVDHTSKNKPTCIYTSQTRSLQQKRNSQLLVHGQATCCLLACCCFLGKEIEHQILRGVSEGEEGDMMSYQVNGTFREEMFTYL